MLKIPSRYYPRIVACAVLLCVAGVTGGVFAAAAVEFVIMLTLVLALAEVLYAVSGFKQHRRLSLASSAVIMAIAAGLGWYILADAAEHGSVSLRIDGYQMLLVVAMGPLLHIEHNRRVTGTAPATAPRHQRAKPAARCRSCVKAVLPRLAWYLAACAVLAWLGETVVALAYPLLSAAFVTAARLLRRGEGLTPVRHTPREPRLVLYVLAEALGASLVAIALLLACADGNPQLTLLAELLALLAGELLLGWHEARAGAQSAWVTSLKSGSSG